VHLVGFIIRIIFQVIGVLRKYEQRTVIRVEKLTRIQEVLHKMHGFSKLLPHDFSGWDWRYS